MVNILGPGGPGINATSTRIPHSATGTGVDTWFGPCIGGDPTTGTKIQAQFLNMLLAQLREAIRGMGVPEDELDDTMLLQAIQNAGASKAGQIEVNAGVNDTKFVTPLKLFHRTPPALVVHANGGQNIGSGAYATISFQTTKLNTLKDSSWNGTTLTIGTKDAGLYALTCQANPNGATTEEGTRLNFNGGQISEGFHAGSNNSRIVPPLSRIWPLVEGDTINVSAYQNSGGSLAITSSTSYLNALRLGDATP